MFDYGKGVEMELNQKMLEFIGSEIENVNFFISPTRGMVCQLKMKNGYVAEGQTYKTGNAENDMAASRRNAVSKLLEIKRYAMMDQLYREQAHVQGT